MSFMPIFPILVFVTLFCSNALSAKPKSICLNMIVKDEESVIERCLTSIKPLIDYWVIVDTGSSDKTPEIIQKCLEDIPGELHQQEWVNFEKNRNSALSLAAGKTDYILFIDADEQWIVTDPLDKESLNLDFYYVLCKYATMTYYRVLLVQSELDWKWQGVLHEYLHSPQAYKSGILKGVWNQIRSEGHRSKDPNKYAKDAALLEQALRKDPFNSRYRFYLAQSYKDAGLYERAIENYYKRLPLGGFGEEIFWSLYQIGLLQEILGKDPSIFIQSYQTARSHSPYRIEPCYRLVHYYRRQGNYKTAYELADSYLPSSNPSIFFVEHWMHEYGLDIEKAFCALQLGLYQKAKDIYLHLLTKDLPIGERESILKNLHILEEM